MGDIILTSVITGLHETKISSHRDVKLKVENDDSIPDIDVNCMVVRIPPIEDIPLELHGAVAYPKSRNPRDPRKKDMLVKEVAGKKVGNVPANLCGLFRRLKASGKVKEIHSFSVGERPVRSDKPATMQKYCRRNQLDRRGGGMILECQYVLVLGTSVDRSSVLAEIQSLLNEMEGNETVY